MNAIPSRRSRDIILGILLFILLLFIGVFPFVAFLTGGLIFGSAMLFLFSSFGAFTIWVFYRARELRFDDGQSHSERMRGFVKALGGIPRIVAFVVGVFGGTILIMALGAI